MRRGTIIGIIGLLIIIIGGGIWLYEWILGDTQEASGPITAIPLDVATTAPTVAATDQTELLLFQIVQEESEVRFIINEELRGEPKKVVGVSNQVAGEIAVDPSDLSALQVGIIQVNARTLVTDEDRRNQAIRNRILNTDAYEFITFTATEIIGLSGRGELGQSYTFQMAGDLTIRNVTQSVVGDVTVQVESVSRLTGSASIVVDRSDYNLVIPNVRFVANVGEKVTLEIDFVLKTIER